MKVMETHRFETLEQLENCVRIIGDAALLLDPKIDHSALYVNGEIDLLEHTLWDGSTVLNARIRTPT